MLDKVGRVRPSSYQFNAKKTKKCKYVAAEKQDIPFVNMLDNAAINCGSEHMCEKRDEKKLDSEACDNTDHADILRNLLADSDNYMMDDNDDSLISDEKWKTLLQTNHLDSDEDDTEPNHSTIESDQPIYPGHSLTVQTSMILILLFTLCHNISGTQLTDLLTLISIHCLHPHPGIKSVHMFKKFFADIKSPIRKHFYCTACMSGVNENDEICPKTSCSQLLNNSRSKAYFLEMPIESQLISILQKEDTRNLLNKRFSRVKKNENAIEDIYDGQIYKSLSGPGGPLSEEYPFNVSFTWNTDGVPIFKSSKFSIWPFYLVINELPYKQRMQKENLLFCGLWFGESKPVMNLFSKPFMDSLIKLETEGIEIEINKQKHTSKGFLLCGTADLPAKSLVMNCTQFNGAFSCMKCMHPGSTYKTQKGGSVHTFPFDVSKPVYNLRTSKDCLSAAVESTRSKKTKHGIKGPSFLMALNSYDFVKSTAIDYMHGVLLGITKLLINLWIGSSFSKEIFSVSAFIDIIDERLTKIKPPTFISRVPRTLSNHFKYWKASELRSWLFFYSLPIMSDILPSTYFIHYACFVEGIFLLSTDSVSYNDLQKSYNLLAFFVHMFPTFYSERYITLNMHSLLHLPKCVEELGPLWVYSCFPFEDMNGVLLDLFHGTQNVDIQIMYSINIIQNMPKMLACIENSKHMDFANRLRHKNPQKKLTLVKSVDSYPLGKNFDMNITPEIYAKLLAEIGYRPTNVYFYKRISLRGATLHSSMYSRVQVRDSFTVKYINSDNMTPCFGSIWYFLLAKKCKCKETSCMCESTLVGAMYIHDQVKESIVERNPLTVNVPHITVTRRTNNLRLINVCNIVSIMVNVNFDETNHLNYLCDVPNMIESD